MEIDNFDIIRKHLDFVDDKLDRYIVHILRRTKDLSRVTRDVLGANEAQRLIKTYYIDSLEYFDRKKEAIKELCRANNARAYIIIQPKDNFECLLNLGKKILDTIQNRNYSVKPEHLLRQAFCETHKTRKKLWILDLDDDQMVESREVSVGNGKTVTVKKQWTLEMVQDFVKDQLEAVGKDPSEMYTIKTPHGHHIITPPFNLMEAQKKCSLLYEGERRIGEQKSVVGWLHKDGMALLWADVIDKIEDNK